MYLLYFLYNRYCFAGKLGFTMKIDIKKIGNSTGVIFPKEVLARLNVGQGDALYLTEMADGSIKLSPYDPDFDEGMKIAKEAMKTYRNALAELAK